MFLDLLISGIRQGLLLVPLALGVHVAFRIVRYPDLTPDGSILLAGAVVTELLIDGASPTMAVLIGALSAGLLGVLTGLLSEVCHLDRILAGISTSLFSYSAVIRLLNSGNVALPPSAHTIYSRSGPDMGPSLVVSVGTLIVVITITISRWGLRLRTVGENEELVGVLGGRAKVRILAGLFWANACVGVSGGIIAQHQRFVDVGQGAGTLFVGLACILVGSAAVSQRRVWTAVLASSMGAIVYALLIAAALRTGLRPGDLRGFTAVLVLIISVLARRLLPGERLPLFG